MTALSAQAMPGQDGLAPEPAVEREAKAWLVVVAPIVGAQAGADAFWRLARPARAAGLSPAEVEEQILAAHAFMLARPFSQRLARMLRNAYSTAGRPRGSAPDRRARRRAYRQWLWNIVVGGILSDRCEEAFESGAPGAVSFQSATSLVTCRPIFRV